MSDCTTVLRELLEFAESQRLKPYWTAVHLTARAHGAREEFEMGRPSQREIEEQDNKAAQHEAEQRNDWPGMTYAEGVHAALAWVLGHYDDKPMDDE